MANVIHGPFVKGAATATGSYGTGVGQSNTYTSGNANNDETQSGVALASFNPDLVGAGFILSGVSCVKDVTTAAQLNITSGAAYLVMTDGTTARIDVGATTESTTGHPSATLYLDLNPDGTWSWGTAHSAQTNYLPICQVTTDGSANILSVADKRSFTPALLAGAKSGPALPTPFSLLVTQNAALAASVTGGVAFGQVGSLPNSMDGAALFNGTSGYLSMPTAGLPTGNAAWSVSARFKTSYSGGSQVILFAGAAATKQAMWLYLDSAGHAILDLYTSSIASSVTGLNNGAWHSAVATWDGTNATLYVDGAQVATSATLGPDNISYTYGLIGAYNPGAGPTAYFNGTLDEVAVYGAALTSANVTTLSNAATSLTSDAYAATVLSFAPLRYYRLGDTAGATYAADTQSPTTQQIVNADGSISASIRAALGVAQWAPVDTGGVVYDNLSSPDGQARSRMLRANSGSNVAISCLALNTDGSITPQGAIGGVGGQASAGSFGVPVIVAQAKDVHVTATTGQNIVAYLPGVTGLYRISGHISFGNTTNEALNVRVIYTDPHLGTPTADFATVMSSTNPILLNGVTVIGNSQSLPLLPITVWASSTQFLTFVYTDPGGTPNDYVSVIIERLL